MRRILLLMAGCFAGLGMWAQSLYVAPGTNLYMGPGTILTIDSLVLTPSAAYNLGGENYLLRGTSVLHPSSNPHINRVFRWNNLLSSFSGEITVFYRDDELNGLQENQLTLNIHDGTGWRDYPTGVTRNAQGNFVVTASLSNVQLGELTLANLTAPLPMRWLSVTAARETSGTLVKWRTANEVNCDVYQVQKSLDGRTWENVGIPVAAKNLQGPNEYSLIDAALLTALTYYRIQQTDMDGRTTHSTIVSVQPDNKEAVMVYPNPMQRELTIVARGGIQLKSVQVYTMAGLLLVNEQLNNTLIYTLPVHRFAGGSYMVRIRLSDGTYINRTVIKQ